MVTGSYNGVTSPTPHLSEPLHGSAPEVVQEVPRVAPLPGVRGLAVRPKHTPVNALRRMGGGEVRLKHAPAHASWRTGGGGIRVEQVQRQASFNRRPRALTSRVW